MRTISTAPSSSRVSATPFLSGWYKGVLFVAGQKAVAEEQLSTAAAETLEGQRAERSRAADSARRHRDEYARLAAQFRVEDAKEALEYAAARMEEAAVGEGAWPAIPDLQALETAQGDLTARRTAIAGAAEGTAPKRRSRRVPSHADGTPLVGPLPGSFSSSRSVATRSDLLRGAAPLDPC